MNYSNQIELVAFLGEIDKRLNKHDPGCKTSLYVFGGAAVVIGYGAPRATRDLDVYFDAREIEKKLLEWGGEGSKLQKKYGLCIQRANTTLMPIEDPDWQERCLEVFKSKFKTLRVMILSKEDLILSKLGRYADRDRADIQYLAEECRADPDKLVSHYKSARSYYVGNLKALDTTFNIVLREHFKMRPIAFKR